MARWWKRTLGLTLMGFLVAWSALDSMAGLKAGVSAAVITPTENMWMSGYASRTGPSKGTEQDLFAKALALEDAQGKRVVLVTTDLIGLTADLSQWVAQKVQQETGLPREALMLTSSHTHSGPVLRNNLKTMYFLSDEQWDQVIRYTAQLEKTLVRIVRESLANLEPAILSRGNGTCDVAINRREFNKDSVSIGLNPAGPVDHDVPVLQVMDQKKNLKAILFGYACHNTTLDFYKFCGDYAGYAQEYLEENNPGALAMFFIGCGGDANPNPRRSLDLAKSHGNNLSQSVQHVLDGALVPVEGTIQAAYELVDLPLSKAPTKEQLQEQLRDENKYVRSRAQELLKTLNEKGAIAESYAYPVQVWNIGEDFLITALGGEVVVDYSLRLKKELGRDSTWVIAYANDVMAYIPSLRVLKEGGYEGGGAMLYYGIHGPWLPPVEELIVNSVHRLVDQNRDAKK